MISRTVPSFCCRLRLSSVTIKYRLAWGLTRWWARSLCSRALATTALDPHRHTKAPTCIRHSILHTLMVCLLIHGKTQPPSHHERAPPLSYLDECGVWEAGAEEVGSCKIARPKRSLGEVIQVAPAAVPNAASVCPHLQRRSRATR